jgi:N-acetylmuramic acid 6-phosphate (MurNAc-6-P) etherase
VPVSGTVHRSIAVTQPAHQLDDGDIAVCIGTGRATIVATSRMSGADGVKLVSWPLTTTVPIRVIGKLFLARRKLMVTSPSDH